MTHHPSDSPASITTRLGPLQVRVLGSGSPAVLWHSLFVDSTTWDRLLPGLSAERRLVLIDGPNHGGNARRKPAFTINDCVGAAIDVLDALDIHQPVDWLGNAWGGHVGILFAADHPERCRSLMTVGAPVHALSASERRQIRLLVALYLIGGPRPVSRLLIDALIGGSTRSQDPDGTALVTAAFHRAGRLGMDDAIRWLSLRRPDLTAQLDRIHRPTLITTGGDDPGWTIADAQSAVDRLSNGGLVITPGDGHIGPVLRPELVDLITRFWRDPDETIRGRQQTAWSAAPGPDDPKQPVHGQLGADPTASPVV
jgi:pimeloyl-ACP methyl ester carboxylesterase